MWKYKISVEVSAGLIVRDTPRPQSAGGKRLYALAKGSTVYASLVQLFEGVPYAKLITSNRDEWIRLAERGGILLEDNGHVEHVPGILTYARVIEEKLLQPTAPTPDPNFMQWARELDAWARANGFDGVRLE